MLLLVSRSVCLCSSGGRRVGDLPQGWSNQLGGDPVRAALPFERPSPSFLHPSVLLIDTRTHDKKKRNNNNRGSVLALSASTLSMCVVYTPSVYSFLSFETFYSTSSTFRVRIVTIETNPSSYIGQVRIKRLEIPE